MPLLAHLLLTLVLTVSPSPPGVWPLGPAHQVVSRFDPPASPWGAGHRGVDLLGSPGQEVHAALAGTVTFAGEIAGRGVVVVDHGGRRTTYEPVDPSVPVGTPVAAGAVIGHLQAGMSHCFPRTCLHWGLIRDDTYFDPLTLVGGGPVRLLPLDGSGRGSATGDVSAIAPSLLSARPGPSPRAAGSVRNRPLAAPLALVLAPFGRGAAR